MSDAVSMNRQNESGKRVGMNKTSSTERIDKSKLAVIANQPPLIKPEVNGFAPGSILTK